MRNVDPMFHMDRNYMWRWYITNRHGGTLAMSTRSFFSFEDARMDFDATMRQVA